MHGVSVGPFDGMVLGENVGRLVTGLVDGCIVTGAVVGDGVGCVVGEERGLFVQLLARKLDPLLERTLRMELGQLWVTEMAVLLGIWLDYL